MRRVRAPSGFLTPGRFDSDDTSVAERAHGVKRGTNVLGTNSTASNTTPACGGRRPAPVNGDSCSAVALGIVRIEQDASAGGYPVDG